MAYSPTTDFLGLLRQVASGVELERMPGLDYVLAALARAGLFQLSVGQTAPTANQTTTVWLRPSVPSWVAEGVVFLWSAAIGAYAPATPALWMQLLTVPAADVFQSVGTSTATVNNSTTLLAVQRVNPAATALLLPPLVGRGVQSLRVVDWSQAVVVHAITFTTPDGATIMRAASWSAYSTPDQLAGLTLRPSINLNGWIIAP